MVSDQEIAKGVETVLRQSDPNAFTSLNGVVQQLEQKLGLDLSHKSGFIRDQINLLLRSPPTTIIPQPPPQQQQDRFALQHFPQFPLSPHFPQQQQQFHHPHFAAFLQQQQQPLPPPPPPTPQPLQQQQRPVQRPRGRPPSVGTAGNASKAAKESNSSGSKRRGGSGGLNKVCGVSPELQAVVGEAALPRTEIVKQLWVYIRKHNLQDPGNKRRIICDEALRSVFETDCTDMFKMNKLLAKHITSLDPTKQSGEVKRLKVETNPATETVSYKAEVSQPPVIVSDALANFFGTGEREMLQPDALRRLWDYIKVNHLEDPLNPMVIVCDAKLQELLGCENIYALGIPEVLARYRLHLFRQQ